MCGEWIIFREVCIKGACFNWKRCEHDTLLASAFNCGRTDRIMLFFTFVYLLQKIKPLAHILKPEPIPEPVQVSDAVAEEKAALDKIISSKLQKMQKQRGVLKKIVKELSAEEKAKVDEKMKRLAAELVDDETPLGKSSSSFGHMGSADEDEMEEENLILRQQAEQAGRAQSKQKNRKNVIKISDKSKEEFENTSKFVPKTILM